MRASAVYYVIFYSDGISEERPTYCLQSKFQDEKKKETVNLMNKYYPEGSLISTFQNRDLISSKAGLERALENQIILEAPAILCDRDFNLHVSLCAGVCGVMERDEVEYIKGNEQTKDIAILTRVGKPICFKIKGFKREEGGQITAFLSRKEAQRECLYNYVETLSPGDVIPAKVTHLECFGAFVDIGCGIISLLSIDSISVSRISHPCARLSVGDSVYTVVKKKDDRGRVYVSERELLGSWEENVAKFAEGQTVKGIVRSVETYGIFVELTPNLAGLAEYKENIHPEQTAAVYIKSIIPEKMKVKLIIIDAADTPQSPQPLEYFINPEKTSHIDSWVYSPPGCKKIIESTFI